MAVLPSHLSLGIFVSILSILGNARAWEAYSETENDAFTGMKQMRQFHDGFYGAVEVAGPLVSKMINSKWSDYRQKYHDKDSVAGNAGVKHSSEESSESREKFSSRLEPKSKVIAPPKKPVPPESPGPAPSPTS